MYLAWLANLGLQASTAGLDFKKRKKDKEGEGRKELETEIKGDRRREI
jgi:hypothetical protein